MAGWPESDYATAGEDGRLLIVVILCANNDVATVHGGSWALPVRQRLLRKTHHSLYTVTFCSGDAQDVVRLEHHFALLPARPARPGWCRLGEAFRRTICGKKRAIDVQQRHQRDVRK